MKKSCFLSSCQYTHGVVRWLSWLHDILLCILINFGKINSYIIKIKSYNINFNIINIW